MGRVFEQGTRFGLRCWRTIALGAAQPGTPFTKPTAASTADAAGKTIGAVYEFPFLAHASMEPMNCVASLHDGILETWSGHQFPSFDHMFAPRQPACRWRRSS
jgi:isoquinoline 1-oxidoreductase beta subunit